MNENVLKLISPELSQYVVDYNDFLLEEEVGTGACGKVYIAVHRPTGKRCALKQLLCKELKGKKLSEFIREIEISSSCNSMFILPLYGFCPKFPFSIVSEYIPRGNLYQALRYNYGPYALTPTQKTIIMIGIAHGIRDLHKINVMHRDLKSLNILLDDRLYPKICDFGISRFVSDQDNLVTENVGTPNWMAPEQMMTQDYTNKVDTYAFGMVVYELLTNSIPFLGVKPQLILIKVFQRKERPEIPFDAPKKIKNLITACWDNDPKKRPSFNQICKVLEKKKVAFRGTDFERIATFYEEISKEEQDHSKSNKLRPSPLHVYRSYSTNNKEHETSTGKIEQFTADILKTGERKNVSCFSPSVQPINPIDIQQINYPLQNEKQQKELSWAQEILQNPTNADFFKALKIWGDYFIVSSPMEFYRMLYTFIEVWNTIPPAILAEIINTINKYSSKSFDSLKSSVSSNILYYLPFGSTDRVVTDAIFSLLYYLTQNIPEFFSREFLNCCTPLIKTDPMKMLKIIQEICNHFDRLEDPWPAADFLIVEYILFIESEAVSSYLSLLIQLLKYKVFYDARFSNFVEVLIYGLDHANTEGIHTIYNCINACFNGTFSVPAAKLEEHINGEFENDVISYLLRDRVNKRTQKLIHEIIKRAPTNHSALSVLIADTISQGNNEAFQEELPNILTSKLRIDQKLMIVMSLLLNEEMRQFIFNSAILPAFIKDLLYASNTDLFDAASNIIIKMLNVKGFSEQIKKYGLLDVYCDVLMKQNHRAAVKLGLYTIDLCARSGLAKELVRVVPWVSSVAISNECHIKFALSVIAAIAAIPEGAIEVSKSPVMQYMQFYSSNNELKTFTDAIFAELSLVPMIL